MQSNNLSLNRRSKARRRRSTSPSSTLLVFAFRQSPAPFRRLKATWTTFGRQQLFSPPVIVSSARLRPFNMATASPPLAMLLAEPLTSTHQLLSLIVPPLARLDLLHDQPELLERFPAPAAEGSDDASKLLKRQLGLVQKALVERVWPDWEAAVAAEEGAEVAKVVFERWFVPASFEDPRHAEVALSTYAVLSSLLSSRATPPLQRRSLELVLILLARLTSAFSLKEAYVAVHGQPKEKNGRANDSRSAERWERVVKDLLSLPTRVANAWSALADRSGVSIGRPSDGIPVELDWR